MTRVSIRNTRYIVSQSLTVLSPVSQAMVVDHRNKSMDKTRADDRPTSIEAAGCIST